jgi:hypothetical protein
MIQMAILSQINSRIPDDDNFDRDGEFWNAHRIRENMGKFDLFPNLPSRISMFHSETSIRKLN